MAWFGCLIFAFVTATMIVPAGAKLIGQGLELAGELLQVHGRALGKAYRKYLHEWRAYFWWNGGTTKVDDSRISDHSGDSAAFGYRLDDATEVEQRIFDHNRTWKC